MCMPWTCSACVGRADPGQSKGRRASDYLPQLFLARVETMAPFWASVRSPACTCATASWATQLTYWPWFFQPPSHGQTRSTSCSPLQPFSPTGAPTAVPGQASAESATPSLSTTETVSVKVPIESSTRLGLLPEEGREKSAPPKNPSNRGHLRLREADQSRRGYGGRCLADRDGRQSDRHSRPLRARREGTMSNTVEHGLQSAPSRAAGRLRPTAPRLTTIVSRWRPSPPWVSSSPREKHCVSLG